MTRNEAKAFIADIVKMREGASDALASLAINVYPSLKEDGSLVSAGTRIKWNGSIKRAASDLWDTTENNPDNAPALWEDINYKQGYRIIPETLTTGTAFALDECGWWEDKLYKSIIDNNVWTPAAYPTGWEVITE